ncbi:uncharacterized protein BXZ73DRAFT_103916 [Epithele typhae]|uniref:uncharacterized protein n=1 Tax=Epithele typhae TaxID=378194 RepID=UPI002008E2C2|nr:uncharacterized protein BXZ73DRAFT_103916 [Epithele typhae]KAH9923118.1 hypothetical protein BXZ73DRAFT_103916 [Epithele typhae]
MVHVAAPQLVDDVLPEIFTNLDSRDDVSRKTLFALAISSRRFSRPALDVLWQALPSDRPLVVLLHLLGISQSSTWQWDEAVSSGSWDRPPSEEDAQTVAHFKSANELRRHPNWAHFYTYSRGQAKGSRARPATPADPLQRTLEQLTDIKDANTALRYLEQNTLIPKSSPLSHANLITALRHIADTMKANNPAKKAVVAAAFYATVVFNNEQSNSMAKLVADKVAGEMERRDTERADKLKEELTEVREELVRTRELMEEEVGRLKTIRTEWEAVPKPVAWGTVPLPPSQAAALQEVDIKERQVLVRGLATAGDGGGRATEADFIKKADKVVQELCEVAASA